MTLSRLLALTSLFCITILIAINDRPDTSVKQASGQRFDGPAEFQNFHKAIRTSDEETEPGYRPGFIMEELKKAKEIARQREAARGLSTNGVIEWKERGPSNVPGRTRGVIVDPDDPSKNTWYAASAGGGVWKTVNGGLTWMHLTAGLPNLATTVIGMAGSDHNIIYMGTGEGFGNLDGIRGNGIFKSVNRGLNWTHLANTTGFSDVNRLIIDPDDANVVVVATANGIFRTTDGGSNWTQEYYGITVQDLKHETGNFDVQYAAQNGTGVLKSTDGGETWTVSSNGMAITGRVELAVSPVNPARIFASAQGALSGSGSDLYMSDNYGENWSLVNVSFNANAVGYLGTQGWYDNTIACDPYDDDVVYVGGIGVFRVQRTAGSVVTNSFKVNEIGTSFLTLVNFSAQAHGGKLNLGPQAGIHVEVRFGPGKSQKAHCFQVPVGATSGVPEGSYSYVNYVTVPFEVWDLTNNRQLMVSFRDQDRNQAFNLYYQNTEGSAEVQSREYLYINNIEYNASEPNPNIAVAGGHVHNYAYFFWPVLTANATWNPASLPNSIVEIKNEAAEKLNANTTTVADVYSSYDGKNSFDVFGVDVHPDQHNIVMIPVNDAEETYKILLANDGGLFISNTSKTPGTNEGNWSMVGRTYNTSQFYGVDKRPGFDEYFGGMQDNGTWQSPTGEAASASTDYNFRIGGDGFEVIWHTTDDQKLIGGSQGNGFRRSVDRGITWTNATSGLSGSRPFVSRLATSKHKPDVLFTVTSEGVFRSPDFGQSWIITPISDKWGFTNLIDIEVSRANAEVVWAGSGITFAGSQRALHVSTDGGKTFKATTIYNEVPMGSITKIATHPVDKNTAYALFSFAGKPKILRTTDLGVTWTDISGFGTNSTSSTGFPNVAVYSLYVRADNPSIIWAGSEIGIVESLDNGATWTLLTDFPNVSIWDVKGQDDQIVIATHGRGIWTAKVTEEQNPAPPTPPVVGVTETNTKPAFSTFPNPTDGPVAVQYRVTTPGEVSAKILDMSGRTITTKVYGYLTAGEYTDTFNLAGKQRGTYLMMLNINGKLQTQKIILK